MIDPRAMSKKGWGLLAVLLLSQTACGLTERTPRAGEEAQGGTDGTGAGSGGTESAGNDGGSASDGPSGGGGTSGAGGSLGADVIVSREGCEDAALVPEAIDEDLTIGPGCVRIERSWVTAGATLTIAPGTTILMGEYLNVTPLSDVQSPIVAIGTAEQPIVFTSAQENPAPGDWECIRIGSQAAASELEHVVIEYAGRACGTTGAGFEGALDVDAPLRGIRNVTVRDSAGYGIALNAGADVREFRDNHFARNADASLYVEGTRLFNLGTGNVFEDEDDFIDVPGGYIQTEGRWQNQGVPLRVTALGLAPGASVTIEPGVVIQMRGGTLDAFNADFNIEGTEEQPVVFTSAQQNPGPGDWGCLLYSYATSAITPRIDHAIFEYAGNGSGCYGSSVRAALVVPQSAQITNTVFRNIAGAAIVADGDECNVEQWCTNTFEALDDEPLGCFSGPVSCE
jgi:hypothetical protein